MRSTNWRWWITAAGAAAGLAAAAAGGLAREPRVVRSTAATRPAIKEPTGPPGPHEAVEFNDGWLAELLLDELPRAADEGKLKELNRTIQTAMFARLCCGHVGQLAALNDMMYALKACVYLPQAEEATGKKDLSKWLLAHRPVARRMFRALSDVPSAGDAFKALDELVAAEEVAVLEYPELAVAFATTEALKHYRDQPSATSLLAGFRWYTQPRVRFRYDLKKLPYELARFLADTRLSPAERQWAARRYSRAPDPSRAYSEVKLDRNLFRKGGRKRIETLPYTLPNILQVGGDPMEQAYFSAEVCKALGVPAAIIVSKAGRGGGWMWLACLKTDRTGRAYWDCRTGHDRDRRTYAPFVRNPATGGAQQLAELMLLGEAAQLPLWRREEADTGVLLAHLTDQVRDKTAQVDPAMLRGLAKLYDQRLAGKSERPQAETTWVKPSRGLDVSLVEDLIEAAIARNLAHRHAWELLLRLRKANRLPAEHLGRFFDVLVTRTAKAYPDYSCEMVLRVVPTIADAAQRETVYRRALKVYGPRLDLAGRILIALGDDYRKQRKAAAAVQAYQQAAFGCGGAADIVMAASVQAEDLLVAGGRRDQAIQMYSKLLGRAKKIRTHLKELTLHYQLGQRLARLLRQAGQVKAAERVERSL